VGLEEQQARRELNRALFLHDHFPGVWQLCQAGLLDGYRASVIADHVRHSVSDPLQLKGIGRVRPPGHAAAPAGHRGVARDRPTPAR